MARDESGAGETVMLVAAPVALVALFGSYLLDWPHSGLTAALRDSEMGDRGRLHVLVAAAAVLWTGTLGYGAIGLIGRPLDHLVRQANLSSNLRPGLSVGLYAGLALAWVLGVMLTPLGAVVYDTMVPVVVALLVLVLAWYLLRGRRGMSAASDADGTSPAAAVRPRARNADAVSTEDSRAWTIDTGTGVPHRIEIGRSSAALGSAARRFTVDGVQHAFGTFGRSPRVARFDLGGRPASLTMRYVAPPARVRIRRALRAVFSPAMLRRYVFLAPLFGGAAGGASASAAVGSLVAWVIYELAVDGRAHESLVSTLVGGDEVAFHRVAPGDRLPDGTDLAWPARPTAAP